jgi:hypothetical protein
MPMIFCSIPKKHYLGQTISFFIKGFFLDYKDERHQLVQIKLFEFEIRDHVKMCFFDLHNTIGFESLF